MNQLKPCPFCGGSVRLDKAYSYFRDSVIYCDDCDMVFTLDDCQASDDEICAVWNTRYLIEYNVEMKDRWIPCSERLPKSVGNKVIVFCTGEDVNDYVGFGHYEVFKNTVTWYNLETCLPFADWGLTVTHWMPLPEPPEKE